MTLYFKHLYLKNPPIADRLLSKFGPTTVMNTTLFMVIIRFFYYSQISLPWQSIPMELINGACFGPVSYTHLTLPTIYSV